MNEFVFPNAETPWSSTGLTKRELFAAMAMAGMLKAPTDVDEWTVTRAVKMADALIAELAKEPQA